MNGVAFGYNDSVFINCPFDAEYMPILRAIIFTVYRCGFCPLTALGEDNASDFRLDKIVRLIKEAKYGVHDLSRTQTGNNGWPRFNMPFELGIFFGAKRFGLKKQRSKNALILEKEKFSYQHFISDLNGVDTKAHNNQPEIVIKKVRDWLSNASATPGIPGSKIIQEEYKRFQLKLPRILKKSGFDLDDITFNDFCKIVEKALNIKPRNTTSHKQTVEQTQEVL